jgi:dihydrofolate reductase
MRKVIFGGANSLDNFIARPDGAVDWLLWSAEVAEIMKEMWPRFDAMVMGRKTYDVALSQQANEDKKIKDLYGDMKVYVFSRTLPAGAGRGGAEIINSDPAEFVAELKRKEGKDIMVMGGGDLAKTLFEAGTIDEIGFNIHPVLLGSGVPLFHKMSRSIDLELIESKTLKNGCVYVRYSVKK